MKIISIVVGVVVVAGVLFYVFYYNKPHRNIEQGKVDFELSAEQLMAEFDSDEVEANNRYYNKILLISGQVEQIIKGDEDVSVVLLEGSGGIINCEVVDDINHVAKDEEAIVKGLFIGYNELLNEVQLKKCQIIEK